MCEQTAFKEA